MFKGLSKWGFSARDELLARLTGLAESSSQASYKIFVKRSLRLHEENFSPDCRAETSTRFRLPKMRFSARLIGLKLPM